MEFPDLGKNCTEPSCMQLDFLPVKCDACCQVFCHEHMKYADHSCPSAYKKDVQVPVCPLCNRPVPVGKNQKPDFVVGAHIDNDCQSQPAQAKRKIFANKCSMKGCKQKEMIPVTCPDCQLNFCLRHRHNQDHQCDGKEAGRRRMTAEAATCRQASSSGSMQNAFSSATVATTRFFPKVKRARPPVVSFQGSMSEDEALARAIAESMNSSSVPSQAVRTNSLTQQEEEDQQLALALQQSEQEQRRTRTTSNNSGSKNCNVS